MKCVYQASLLLAFFGISCFTSFSQCPPGEYKPDPFSPCITCTAGSYCPGDGNSYPCPAGSAQANTGSTSCSSCPAGSYSNSTGSTSCTLCPSGTYQSGTGSTSCFDCPPSAVGAPPGGTNLSDCFRLLPANLLYFKADIYNKGVGLIWATSTETDNDHFEIERSTNNGVDFILLGALKGAGTTINITQYHYNDFSPENGINYYRLKQFDRNGRIKVSPIRSAQYAVKNVLVVYTNISAGQLIIKKNSDKPIEVNVYNASGQLKHKSKILQATTYISIKNWSAGLYNVHALVNGEIQVSKFLK